MPYQNSQGTEVPCFRVNSKNTQPAAAYIDSLFAYKFDSGIDYTVYTYGASGLEKY